MILAGALMLTLMACQGTDPETRPIQGLPPFCQEVLPQVDAFLGQEEQPTGDRYGGTAVAGGIGAIPDGMNGFALADYTGAQHMTFLNLMTLIQVDEELEPRPYLARSWDVSDDGTELTFHLRQDVFWHDGERTTARDVAFTYLRATHPETGFPNAAFWDRYVAGPEGVQVLDEFTVRFRLHPHAEFLDPWRAMPIMPEHLLGDVPPAELAQHPYGTRCPVGNGPFAFFEHRPDASWTFTRNPAFPPELGGPPFLDRYVYRIIPEQSTLHTELLTGEVDIQIAPPPEQAPRIIQAPEARLLDFDFRSYAFVAWNARQPALSDPRVRQALTMATDRGEVVEALLGGYGEVANAGVPPFHWGYDPTLRDTLGYDPEEAGRLLDEAGWVDRTGDGVRADQAGIPLEISIKFNPGNQQRRDIAEIMQAQLAQVGVSVRLEVVEWATLFEQITSPGDRNFDGVVMGWVTELKVDDHDLFHSSKVEQPFQWAGMEDGELDMLLDTLQLLVDREEAIPFWHRYQERLVELQPYTYFFFPRRLAGVSSRLRGVEMDVRGEWVTVADWWIPEEDRRDRTR